MTKKTPVNKQNAGLMSRVPQDLSKQEMVTRLLMLINQLEKTIAINCYQPSNDLHSKHKSREHQNNTVKELRRLKQLVVQLQQHLVESEKTSLETKGRLRSHTKEL